MNRWLERILAGLLRRRWHTYDDYLRSKVWQSKRRRAIRRVLQIGTLAETLMQISPRRRRDAITAMIDRVELNADGEFVKVIWAEEFRHAILSAAEACRNDALDRCRDETLSIALDWFAKRAA